MEIRKSEICAVYSPEKDLRPNKVPLKFRKRLELAKWNHDSLGKKVERKFNQLGWFRCLKNSKGEYDRIVFGQPINYETFLELFTKGSIFLDCGMYQGNARPYMTWRAKNNIWDELAEK